VERGVRSKGNDREATASSSPSLHFLFHERRERGGKGEGERGEKKRRKEVS